LNILFFKKNNNKLCNRQLEKVNGHLIIHCTSKNASTSSVVWFYYSL